jgi:hypothetical protein
LLCLEWLLFDAGRQDLAMVYRAVGQRGMARVLASIGIPNKARLKL